MAGEWLAVVGRGRDWDAGGISISKPHDRWLLDQRPDTHPQTPRLL